MADTEAAAAQVSAITGLPANQAKFYLEMSGNNVELAVQMFFEGGMMSQSQAPVQNNQTELPPVVQLVWGSKAGDLPASWTQQTLEFGPNGFGLVQPKNGPCGVLAIIQAMLICNRFEGARQCSLTAFTDLELCTVLSRILWTSRFSDNPVQIALYDNNNELVITTLTTLPELREFVQTNLDTFRAPMGLLQFVYSCVLTRGLDNVRKEAECPLIEGPNALTTTDLMSIMIRGVANGNVGAFGATGEPNKWPQVPFGLLSNMEIESKIPIADALKCPMWPVWILHGGDHFTVMFSPKITNTQDFEFYHWNGLPPGGPRLSQFNLRAIKGVADNAALVHKPSYVKPLPGEIEDIVQAHKNDKEARPKAWNTWRYECVLAVEDPSVTGANRDPGYVPKIFDYGSPPQGIWRCASCYRQRFQLFYFKENPPADICQNCLKTKEEVMWSIWVPFEDLPEGWQRKMTIRHADKVLPILWTKFPDALVEFVGDPPSV